MKRWTVYLPGNRHFELESDHPHEDMAAQGFDAYGLMEIAGRTSPENPDTGKDDPLLLTVEQTAKLLQLGRDTVYNLTHIPSFPAIRIGRNVRINRDQLQSWLNENKGGILL